LEDESVGASVVDDPGVPLQYQLDSVRIEGNRRTRSALILPFVPLRPGSSFDVGDPELDAFRYRLLGTGWFDRVDIRLERGPRPGWVVLVVFVEERETLMFQQLALGVGWSVDHATGTGSANVQQPLAEPYLGMAVADTNFLGTGKTVGTELLLARDQQGIALSYGDPVIRTARWGLSTRGTFVNGQEYFGGDHEVLASTSCIRNDDSTQIVDQCEKRWGAVVDYWRVGLNVGGARDIGAYTRLVVGWAGDFVQVPTWGLPQAASEVRGRTEDAQSRRPIDFAIHRGSSLVSLLRFGLVFDKRDSAILPTSGSLVSLQGSLSSRLFGGDYNFVRTEANLHHWFPTGWGHTVRLGAFFGTVFGDAPFFYKFFVSDLTDLLPSRILGLNLDHRPAPNLFGAMAHPASREAHGTAIAQMRQEELAGRIDAEYVWPLARGRRKFLKNADAYGLIGVYALADPRDLKVAVPGYDGAARVPVDLTFDLGVRMDTQIGVFQIGLAKLLWLPVR
jgi:outer membrane protein assembly factor BamA